jgi:amino acid transporter
LLFAMALGLDALGDAPARAGEIVPHGLAAWQGLAAGAFLAFFAFIGFETLANMAEETRDVAKTLPRAIVAAIVAASLLYGLLALIAVLAVPIDALAKSTAPLCLLLDRAEIPCGRGFAAVALIALSNGIIVELMLMARLLYGMAKRGLVPAWFGAVNARSRAPVRATLIGGAAMLVFVVALPFEKLAGLTSALTLAVFAAVNVSLAVLKWRDRHARAKHPPIRMPMAVPVLGAIACVALLLAAL